MCIRDSIFLHDLQNLIKRTTSDRNDHPAARFQLTHQWLRDLGCARCHQDAVEWRGLRPTQITISLADLNILESKPVQSLFCARSKLGNKFDRVDFTNQSRQDRGLISGACSY